MGVYEKYTPCKNMNRQDVEIITGAIPDRKVLVKQNRRGYYPVFYKDGKVPKYPQSKWYTKKRGYYSVVNFFLNQEHMTREKLNEIIAMPAMDKVLCEILRQFKQRDDLIDDMRQIVRAELPPNEKIKILREYI